MLSNETMISVIIPAYNIDEYIEYCLKSVSDQTYKNLEIIVVDDGSNDRTPEIIDEYAKQDDRVRVIHKENGGVTTARLCGVKEAKGSWIGFVDGDDYIEPDMYERLMTNAVNYKANISHCGYQMVFTNRVDYYFNTGRLMQQDSSEALKDLIDGAFEPCLCNKVFQKTLFDNIFKKKLINEEIRINEDLLMNFYLFREANKLVYEDFCPYHYQVRKGSAATSRLQSYKLSDPIKVCNIIAEENKKDPELYSISIKLLTEKLIRVATVSYKNTDNDIRTCVFDAREQLKKLLPIIRKQSIGSSRTKLLAEWAAASPSVYRIIHSVYGSITGRSHKYDI